MPNDLIAKKVAKSDDAYNLFFLQRLLHSEEGNSNIFDQYSPFWNSWGASRKEPKRYVCRSTSIIAGEVFFKRVHAGRYPQGSWSYISEHTHLYERLGAKPKSYKDIKYNSARVKAARDAIASSLLHGIPVCVGCVHDVRHYAGDLYDHAKKRLDYGKGGGHSVLIVGCDSIKRNFLYIDPSKGMSKLEYKGGIATTGSSCENLGLFKLDETADRGPILKSARLEVLAAPTKIVTPSYAIW
jgi:hypothetical protein